MNISLAKSLMQCTAPEQECVLIPQRRVQNLKTCNSHIERFSLSLRTFVKRFSRLSLGFSKKLGNLKAAVALHGFHYNFCRIHSSIRCTPAMRANLTDHIWKLDDLFG